MDKQLISQLNNSDEKTQVAAAIKIVELAEEYEDISESFPTLIKHANKNEKIAHFASMAMFYFATCHVAFNWRPFEKQLLILLKHNEIEVAQNAAKTLALYYYYSEKFDEVKKLIFHSNNTIRIATLQVIPSTPCNSQLIAALIACLDDLDTQIQYEASRILTCDFLTREQTNSAIALLTNKTPAINKGAKRAVYYISKITSLPQQIKELIN